MSYTIFARLLSEGDRFYDPQGHRTWTTRLVDLSSTGVVRVWVDGRSTPFVYGVKDRVPLGTPPRLAQ